MKAKCIKSEHNCGGKITQGKEYKIKSLINKRGVTMNRYLEWLRNWVRKYILDKFPNVEFN